MRSGSAAIKTKSPGRSPLREKKAPWVKYPRHPPGNPSRPPRPDPCPNRCRLRPLRHGEAAPALPSIPQRPTCRIPRRALRRHGKPFRLRLGKLYVRFKLRCRRRRHRLKLCVLTADVCRRFELCFSENVKAQSPEKKLPDNSGSFLSGKPVNCNPSANCKPSP